MLEEVVEVAIPEVKLLKNVGDLLALLAFSSQDGFNDGFSVDDVEHVIDFDFIDLIIKVFFSKEGNEIHHG